MYAYVFAAQANAEMLAIGAYYEQQQVGLGQRFITEIEDAALEIASFPLAYRIFFKSTREKKMRKFPYLLIYTFEDDLVFIHAVFPCKSNPQKKQSRLS